MVSSATSDLLFLSSYGQYLTLSWLCQVKSIATAQNYRYLVLTCRRIFAMVLPMSLGPSISLFLSGSTDYTSARGPRSKWLFNCGGALHAREVRKLRLYGNGGRVNLTPGSSI
jgi:hypothetical protein